MRPIKCAMSVSMIAVAITGASAAAAQASGQRSAADATPPASTGQAAAAADQAVQSPTTPAEAEPAQVGDIVVTAQKRAESITRVPLSIQAFSGDGLKAAGVVDAASLTQVVPGLTFAKSGSNTPIYTLRGVGFNTRNVSATSPVGLYENEVSYAYPYFGNGPLFDIQRTEVLKGPQGTLYGRNTTGGLINFITARPGDHWEGGISAELGNYKTYNFEGFVSGPLGNTAGVRIAFRDENSDEGWQRSITRPGDRLGQKDRLGARVSLDWKPTDRLASQLTANFWRDRSDTQAGQAIAVQSDVPAFLPPDTTVDIVAHPSAEAADWTPPNPATNDPRLQADARFFAVSERMDLKVSDAVTLTSLTGYNNLARDDGTDQDASFHSFASAQLSSRIASISEEFRLSFDQGPVKAIAGLYYAHDAIRDSELINPSQSTVVSLLKFLAPLANPNPFNPAVAYTPAQLAATGGAFFDSSRQESRTASVFGNLEYALSDQLKLSGGVRYSSDRLTFGGCTYDVNNAFTPLYNTAIGPILAHSSAIAKTNGCTTYNASFTAFDDPEFRQVLSEDNVSFRGTVDYTPTRDFLLYATIARGYKNGAFPVIPANVETQLAPARQEELMTYEGGLKATLANRRLQINAAGFYYDYTNRQTFGRILDPVFTTLERIVNVPKSRIYGGEAEIIAQATPELSLNLGATLLSSRITRYSGFDDLGKPEDFAGKRSTFTPFFQANGGFTYKRRLSDRVVFDLATNGSYQSVSYGDLANTDTYKINGYFLLNASAGFDVDDGKWNVTFWGRNITNQNYAVYTGFLRELAYRLTGMPVTFGATIGRRF